MEKEKARLVLIYPGPSYWPVESFGERLLELSRDYKGFLVTSAPTSRIIFLHGFEVVCVSRSGGKIATFLRLVKTVVMISVRSRSLGSVDLVSSYDPLRSGLLALIIKGLTKARFASEVNGDYDNRANYSNGSFGIFSALRRARNMFVERWVLSRADGIKLLYPTQLDGLSIDTKGKVIRSFFDRSPIELFNDGIEEKHILSVGFPLHVKGMDITIAAFRRISHKYPEWKLKIVGWYPEPQKLLEYIKDCSQIELLKPVRPSEMPDLIGKCAILVQASRTEAMGRVLVEAMAAGKARIGTNVGGIPTVLEHESDGLLVQSEDIDALAVAMERLISSPQLRKRLGQAGKKRAVEEFSRSHYYEHVLGFFKDVLLSCRHH